MTTEDFGIVFQGAVRLHGQSITVHGTMRLHGCKGQGHLLFPPEVPPELGRYYPLTLTDGTRMEIVVDDLEDGQALFTVLDPK
jgi:hypothetical protein